MITLPYNIANGQALDAIPVMANFNALASGAAASGVNSDITQLTGLTTPLTPAQGGTGQNVATTPLTIAKGGTGAATQAAAQAALNATPVPVAQGGTADTGTAWSTQTVTPTAGTGSLTTASAVWRFKVIGKTAFFSCNCTITTNGTGAVNILVPLPTGWVPKATSVFGGQGTVVSGKAIAARMVAAGSSASLLQYDASYPGASGEVLAFSGVVELT